MLSILGVSINFMQVWLENISIIFIQWYNSTEIMKVTHYRKALGFLMNVLDAVILMQIKSPLRYIEEVNTKALETSDIDELMEKSRYCLMNIHTDKGLDLFKSTLDIVRNIRPVFDNFLELGSQRSKALNMWKIFPRKICLHFYIHWNQFCPEIGSKIWLPELI